MEDDIAGRADARFALALEETGARDPRDFYRRQMAGLRASSQGAFDEARRYYSEVLVPEVADGKGDPLQAWMEFGRRLAEWSTPGRPMMIDPLGIAHPWREPVPLDHLVLHLPDARTGAAIPIGIPASLTPPQRATWDLLVGMKQELT